MGSFIEFLESRLVLAGNVTATAVGGELVIEADRRANGLYIDAGPGPDQIRITGDRFTGINGAASPVVFSGVRSLRMTLGRADDRVSIDGIYLQGGLTLDLGRGADVVTLSRTTVGGQLIVNGGGNEQGGDDRLQFEAVHSRGAVKINSGSRPLAASLRNSEFDQDSDFQSGNGADTLNIFQSTFAGRFVAQTGGGADTVALNASTFAVRPTIGTGDGDDSTLLGGSVFVRRPRIDGGAGVNSTDAEGFLLDFDFRNGSEGWTGGFSDIEPNRSGSFIAGLGQLPAELGISGTGFQFSGTNVSDDLFMFLKRSLGPAEGIQAGRQYRLTFTIDFASDAPSFNSGGVGGSPGSVYLKAGGTTIEPQSLAVNLRGYGRTGYLQMNVNKGNQIFGGPAASFVSAIDNGLRAEGGEIPPYVSLSRTHTHRQTISADSSGHLWLLVGTDSAFEGRTTLYYQRIRIAVTPVQ